MITYLQQRDNHLYIRDDVHVGGKNPTPVASHRTWNLYAFPQLTLGFDSRTRLFLGKAFQLAQT